jgi:opacity protein-like surface antigen
MTCAELAMLKGYSGIGSVARLFFRRGMIMLKKMVVALALVAPTAALAQQPGPYFTIGAAVGSVDLDVLEGPGAVSDDDVQRVVIGAGAQLNENLAIEATYLTNSENTVKTGPVTETVDHSGGQLSVLMSAPITPQFSVFGKVSGNFLTVEYEDSTNPAAALDDSGFHLGVGAGMAFQINDQMGVRATFERLMITDVGGSNGDFDVDQIAVALNYSF